MPKGINELILNVYSGINFDTFVISIYLEKSKKSCNLDENLIKAIFCVKVNFICFFRLIFIIIFISFLVNNSRNLKIIISVRKIAFLNSFVMIFYQYNNISKDTYILSMFDQTYVYDIKCFVLLNWVRFYKKLKHFVANINSFEITII